MRIDPAKHSWMTAPETRKLMAAPPSRDMTKSKIAKGMSVVPVISRDTAKVSERRHAH